MPRPEVAMLDLCRLASWPVSLRGRRSSRRLSRTCPAQDSSPGNDQVASCSNRAARQPARPLRSLAQVLGVLLAALTFAACSSSGPAGSRSVSVFRLRPGDCLITPKKIQAELTSIEEVPCTTPHTQQVYALVRDHGGSTYPPVTALDSFANAQCLDHFAAYVGVPYQDSSLYFTYLLPSVRSWAAGDRTVVCVAETVGKPLRRSVKGSKL